MQNIRLSLTALALTAGTALAACQSAPSSDIPDLAFHRGQNALALGRYDWARRYFQRDLESHPGRPESLRGLGLGWISGFEGSLSHGIESLSAYLEQVPGDDEIRLRLARSWLRLAETERALEALEDAPPSAEAHQLRAEALADADPEAAERQVTAALELEPDAVGAQLLAARLAERRGDGTSALAHAEAAARTGPTRAETRYLLARIRRGLGDEEGARRELATYEQLRRLPMRGRPSELSPLEELETLRALASRESPPALSLRVRLARLRLTTGDPGAVDAISELVAEPAAAISFLELAAEAHTRARADLARDLYRRALELDPELKAARAQLARLEHETGDREAAGRLLAEGLAVDPYHAEYHFVTGLLELGRGDEPAAIRAFETALELAPWLASYRLALADVYLAAGRRDDLERVLDQAPAEDPALTAYRRRHLRR